MIHRDGLSARLRDHFDWSLFIAAALIAVFGVTNLYSATSVYSGNRAELYISQIQWLAIGGIVAGVVLAIDYRHLERFAYVLYTFGVFNLVLVFALGKGTRGSQRWIQIGPFAYQPSEFMKIWLIIALAKFLHDDPRSEGRQLRDLLMPAILTGVPAFLVLRQPDLGTASILVLVFLMIAAVTRVHWKSIALFFGSVLPGVYIVYEYVLLGYQKDRITVFLNPEADVKGLGYHAHHARIAIGDGGLFGTGFMKGTQNQFGFIPDQFSDFPFPVFAEEWGFVGSVVLISFYAFLTVWGVRVASLAKDRFGAVLAIGGTAIIFWHAIINIGMTSGVLPVVGVTLPLFSYGGSSMLTILLALALVMNVSMRRSAGVPSPDRL
ncbi:Rod shape-determining protein RodA [Minicystis rosea]|nr:Rod shape-determining protein RodA [Minicystis rosea]